MLCKPNVFTQLNWPEKQAQKETHKPDVALTSSRINSPTTKEGLLFLK